MEVSRVAGTGKSEKTKGLFISFYEQWSGFIGRSNWYDFTLLLVQGEYAPYSGRWEFEIGLFGLRLNIQYVYDDSFANEMRARMDEIVEGRKNK